MVIQYFQTFSIDTQSEEVGGTTWTLENTFTKNYSTILLHLYLLYITILNRSAKSKDEFLMLF